MGAVWPARHGAPAADRRTERRRAERRNVTVAARSPATGARRKTVHGDRTGAVAERQGHLEGIGSQGLRKGHSGVLFAEQQPLALTYFIYGRGDPRQTVLTAVKGGRDAESIACNSAAWLGALGGVDVWPREWVETA